jgi:hypothetical protein
MKSVKSVTFTHSLTHPHTYPLISSLSSKWTLSDSFLIKGVSHRKKRNKANLYRLVLLYRTYSEFGLYKVQKLLQEINYQIDCLLQHKKVVMQRYIEKIIYILILN